MVREFGTSEPETALRVYLYLIGRAACRKTVTYGELSRRIKRGDDPNLLAAKPLDLVTQWCKANGQPALVSLVVENVTGLPPPGRAATPAEQERVWDYDWFVIFPPIEELR